MTFGTPQLLAILSVFHSVHSFQNLALPTQALSIRPNQSPLSDHPKVKSLKNLSHATESISAMSSTKRLPHVTEKAAESIKPTGRVNSANSLNESHPPVASSTNASQEKRIDSTLMARRNLRSSKQPVRIQEPLKLLGGELNLGLLGGEIPEILHVKGLLRGGWATYFTQNGRPGACGKKHKDSDVIVALDYRRYGGLNTVSKYCGRTVEVTSGSRTIRAKVADVCPTCLNKNSLDLSEGAFRLLGATVQQGMVHISWKFV